MLSDRMDRRQFLYCGAAAAAMAAVGRVSAAPAMPTVAVVRDKSGKVVDGYTIDAAIARRLVDQAVMTVTGKDDIAKAWGTLVQPNEKVAIKFNGLFARAVTHPEVIHAVTAGLIASGVKPENIVIFDRSDKDMQTTGLTINRDGAGPRIYGTGGDRSKEQFKAGSVSSHLSNLLLNADALINLPCLKTHVRCGMTGAMKNHLGTVDNAGAYHGDFNNLCALNALAPIREKTRLCLCDGLYAQYDRGPQHDPRLKWDYCGIVASKDPVALDSTLTEILRAKRKEKGLPPDSRKEISYVAHGEAIGLGVAAAEKMKRVEIEI